jgi:hypothetical protein
MLGRGRLIQDDWMIDWLIDWLIDSQIQAMFGRMSSCLDPPIWSTIISWCRGYHQRDMWWESRISSNERVAVVSVSVHLCTPCPFRARPNESVSQSVAVVLVASAEHVTIWDLVLVMDGRIHDLFGGIKSVRRLSGRFVAILACCMY